MHTDGETRDDITRVCSWCGAEISPGRPGGPISHGICEACRDKVLASAGIDPQEVAR